MIILEGPDKAGKSTLAQQLVEKLGAKYYHFENPKPGEIHTLMAIEALGSEPANTVFDRCGLSGFAYDYKSPSDQTRVMTSLTDLQEIMTCAVTHHTVLVQVFCYEDDLMERFHREGDANNYVNERELKFTNNLYHLLFAYMRRRNQCFPGVGPDVLEYNTSLDTAEAWIEKYKFTLQKYLSEE